LYESNLGSGGFRHRGQGPALGRADAARRLEEAHKLLEEVSDMLAEMPRELLGSGRR
jgi:hypothetical protein